MTQLAKLKAKLRARPTEAKFADVRKLLELNGWTMKPQDGTSHVIFKKAGERSLTVPISAGTRVKGIYLDKFAKQIGLDD